MVMKICKLFKGYNIFLTAIFLYQVIHLLHWGMDIDALKPLIYIGPLLFLFGLLKNYKDIRTNHLSPFYKMLMIAFFIMWIRFDINGANGGTIQDITGAGATLFFFIMLYNPYKFKISSIIKFTIILGFVGVMFSFANYDKLLAVNAYSELSYESNERGATMSMAAVYCLLNSALFLLLLRHVTPKVRNISFFLVVVSILVAMIAGRRGYTLLGLIFLAEFFFMFIVLDKKKPLLLKSLIVVTIIYCAYIYYLGNADTQFKMFTARLETYSRSGVFYYWEKTMNHRIWNWVIGEGVSGGYWDGDFCTLRPNIENGVRNCLMKGGFLYLISYMGLAVHAIYLAFFQSRNSFMRGLSLYIFSLLVFMFIWGTPSISFLHLNMWISYVWIFNKRVRFMTDEEINKYIY